MMHRISRSFLLIFLFFAFFACTQQIRPTAPEVINQDASLDELLQLYQQRLNTRSTLKALIEIKADLGQRGKHTFQSVWRSERNRVKMRGFNLFGGTLFDLDLSATGFSIDLPSEGKVFEGDLEFFDDMAGTRIPFGSRALLEWVKRGGTPEVGLERIPALEKRDDVFILYLFSSALGRGFLKEKIWIERTAFQVQRVELFDRTGHQKGTILLEDYHEVHGRFFPYFIRATNRGQVLELHFKEVSFPVDPFSSVKASQ